MPTPNRGAHTPARQPHDPPEVRITFLDRDSAEWGRMWRHLAMLPVNAGLDDPAAAEDEGSGEVWQYMGTVPTVTPGVYAHQFRHRCHPRTGRREYVEIPGMVASEVVLDV